MYPFLRGTYRKILILSFEDSAVVTDIKRSYPNTEITIFTKADTAGKSFAQIVQMLRKEKWDLFVLSNRNAQVRRSRRLLQALAFVARARKKYIIYETEVMLRFSRCTLLVQGGPALILELMLGSMLVVLSYPAIALLQRWFAIRELRSQGSEKETPKVAFLRTDLASSVKAGGSVSHIQGVTKALSEFACSIFVVADGRLSGVDERKIAMFVIPPPHWIEFFDEFVLIAYNYKFAFHALKIIKKEKPSFIYQRHSVFCFAGVFLAEWFGIPMILEVNSSEVWVKKHWGKLYLEGLATQFERIAFRYADGIVVVSEILKKELAGLGVEEGKILVNPNGVDPDEFNPAINGDRVRIKYGLGKKHLVVGFIGTFAEWHGVRVLVDAIERIAERAPKSRFLLIGEGNLRSELELKIAQSEAHEHVIFTGLISHRDAPEYLAACDVLVAPHIPFKDGSEFFGSPTKLFEYMAMGKAIVASGLGQIGEIIKDYVNGLKITPGSVEELVDAILILAENEELRGRLGKQARKDVIEKYTWQSNARRVIEGYRNLLEEA